MAIAFAYPTLAAKHSSRPATARNPLVNAFALGMVKKDEIFLRQKRAAPATPLIYVGAKTGCATAFMAPPYCASEEFHEGTEAKRPNVQVGDPFMEKLLMEACLEAMQTGAIVGIQDMGAAGLTCSTCEMGGAAGGVGLDVELDLVPQRETGMELRTKLCSQRARSWHAAGGRRAAAKMKCVARLLRSGASTESLSAQSSLSRALRIHHHGVLVADIPNQSLTDDAPLYHRPVGVWKTPAPTLRRQNEMQGAALWQRTATLPPTSIKLLSGANVCSKRWALAEQYDTMVQTNTVIGPGGEGGVMRIKGTGAKADDGTRHERGLSMALDGNSRWAYLNPNLGAKHAVAEAARKVAMAGATPVAATNCLNFGNPEKPEIMAQLSSAIDGIAEACTALSTPITGGNVSLYNETRGIGIYPTPVLGIVGILDDVTLAVPAHFKKGGDAIVLLWPIPAGSEPDPNLKVPFPGAQVESSADPYNPLLGSSTALHPEAVEDDAAVAEELIVFGSSEYASVVLGGMWGQPPSLDLDAEADLHTLLAVLAERQLIHSARDISDGGIAVSLAQAGFPLEIGATVEQDQSLLAHPLFGLFAEPASTVLVTSEPNQVETIEELADEYGYFAARIGTTGGNKLEISVYRQPMISASLASLRKPWASALEATLHGEVLA